MKWWCNYLNLSVGVRHGDTSQSDRRKQALNPPNLLVTTPETLQAMFMGKRLREHLKNIKFVIVDEIHDLAGTKRGAQLSIALERLVPYAGEFQRIGLSATVGNPNEIAEFLTGDRKCEIVEVPIVKKISIDVEIAGDKYESQVSAIKRQLKKSGSTLIFVNTRSTAELLSHTLAKTENVDVHHGSLSKDIRIEAEEKFKNGEIKTLICTSSMELGIDIGHIDRVVQFGSPREVNRLVQRIGRAGHQIGKVSKGTIIASGFDDLLESLVISRLGTAGLVEPVMPTYDAGDVIANQIAALAVEYGEISINDVRTILSRSPIVKSLDFFDDIIKQMLEHYLIRVEDQKIITTGRARRYLSGNLSMIPDEKKVPIYDMVSRRTVGSLDESFIITSLHTGAVFIARGQLWRVLDLEDGKITVEPAKNAEGELPSWEGEQIPVPFAVANEVGALRRTRKFSEYTDDEASIKFAEGYLLMAEKNHAMIPTDKLITLEKSEEGIVINLCAGHQVNEAFGRVISILISARSGSTIGMDLDAYRILLRVPRDISTRDVLEVIHTVQPGHVRGILEIALKRTSLFKWKLVQVAKKFGAIDPDADYERISFLKLTDLLKMPSLEKEAYRELFSHYMDIDGAARIIEMIGTAEIETTIGPQSVFGAGGLLTSRDLIPPPTEDQAVISTLKHRIEEQDIFLACMNCRKWKVKTKVSRVPENPVCGICGARLIAVLKPYEEEHFAISKKEKKSTEEKAIEKRLIKNANMVLSSGKKAIFVLAAKGVGPDTASRILGTFTEGDALYREIIKAERNFIKTHRFWQ